MDQTRWADLLPDLLCEIAAWLDDVADFVRFHAVCKPWRASRDEARPPLFLPWLLAADGKDSAALRFRCIFSKSSYRSMLPSTPPRYRVCSATAIRYLTIEHPRHCLYDLLTRETAHNMPRLPYNVRSQWDKNNPQGIIYGDGKILLYSSSITNISYDHSIRAMFTAALLHPGDSKWTLIDTTFDDVKHLECRAAYHGGRILVTMGTGSILQVIMPEAAATGDLLVPGEYECKDCYVFESHGELLWASVRTSYSVSCKEGTRNVDALWVLVHKLEEEDAGAQGKKMRWEITKRCKALEVKHKQQKTAPVTSLPSIIHFSKHYEPCFRVMVRNLPITVNGSQLELFFGKHGKVTSAEVLYHKDTKCSQGVGFVTMSTVYAHPQDAIDAFGKMILDGCSLEVTLVKQGRPRYHQRHRLPS
ncbi:hypothetical protein CFC21_081456 [Triticum aestivum]|uniref:RRM domain-containing protein n=2 Tax=Triticum aestivum TaxID=4565 RepID=A0A3B6NJN8_WHEAT|nr:hypothetical protein CFC21_081456 [Triticum aestivum]